MKAKLEELSETPANLQRLVFRGHMLKDEQTLSHHSMCSHSRAMPSLCSSTLFLRGPGSQSGVCISMIKHAMTVLGACSSTGCVSIHTMHACWDV